MSQQNKNNREIRVFLSSTFRDMQHERDYLIKKIFPQIRHVCRERLVEFTEVDLRWGVTREDASKHFEKVGQRTRAINRKLRDVEALPVPEDVALGLLESEDES